MADKENAMWGMHAGSSGEADDLFLKGNSVAFGWQKAGDLSQLPADREAFKRRIAESYPEMRAMQIASAGGQLFRFVHEMKANDVVVYPSKQDKQIHFGRVEGGYTYDKRASFPHTRQVTWLRGASRTQFTQGALYEVGSAMTLFQVRNYADEFRAVLEGTAQPPTEVSEDETTVRVAEEIEQNTRDFILKRLARELKGHPMSGLVAHLLGAMGYRCRVSEPGPDGGVDIIAHRDELGFEPPLIKVQVKTSSGSVGGPVVSALYGHVSPGEFGLLVTLGTFTSQARSFAQDKNNLRPIDGEELVSLVLQHYEELDPRYKGLLPLKRVYVPQPIQEAQEE